MNQKNEVVEGEVVEPKTDLVPVNQRPLVAIQGSDNMLFNTDQFDHLWRVANLFAKSDLVPVQYKGKTENCMIVLQMAHRLNVDTMMFMQNTYVVHGKPGMEAKLVIALVNSRGPFSGPIQWKLEGEGDKRSCTAYATHKVTDQICRTTVDWKMVKGEGWDKNQKWHTMTDLMFQYRSATFLARLYAPECIMGMKTVDEIYDVEVISDPVPNDGLTQTERLADELVPKELPAGSAPEQENTEPPTAMEPSQSELQAECDEEVVPPDEETLREKAWRMLLEMYGGIVEDAKEALYKYSTYTPKQGPRKDVEKEGVRDIEDKKFSEAWLKVTYGKIKPDYKVWYEKTHAEAEPEA